MQQCMIGMELTSSMLILAKQQKGTLIQLGMTDNNTPICYPFLHGYLKGALRGLAFDLGSRGLVDRDKLDQGEEFINEKIENAHKAEREHAKQYPS